MTISLRSLTQGCKARILRVNATGEIGRRMRDMGFVRGAVIEVKTRALFLDPVALRLDGVSVALRNNEADAVTVELCA